MADISNLTLNQNAASSTAPEANPYEYDYLLDDVANAPPATPPPEARRRRSSLGEVSVSVGNFKLNDCHGGAADDDDDDDDINPYTGALRDGDVGAFFRSAQALHAKLKQEKPSIITNRRYHLRTYKSCFRGTDLVDWLTLRKVCATRVEATAVGSSLVSHGIIHHAVDDHGFCDNGNFYRFRYDDSTAWLLTQPEYPATAQLAVRLHSYLGCSANNIIANRQHGVSTFKLCFVGSCMVTLLVKQGIAPDRAAATAMCRRFCSFGFVSHVCDDHEFKDEYLFYRFYADTLQHDPAFLDFTQLVSGLCFLGHIRADPQEHDPWERCLKGPGAEYVLSDEALKLAEANASVAPEAEFDGFGEAEGDDEGAGQASEGFAAGGQAFKRAMLGDGFLFGDTDPRSQPGYKASRRLTHAGFVDDEAKNDASQADPSEDLAPHAWYHGDVKREDVLQKFQKNGNVDGSWLIRQYRKRGGWFVLSECFRGAVYHTVIQNVGQQASTPKYRVVPGPTFESIETLCAFYASTAHDELPTLLTAHVPNLDPARRSSARKQSAGGFC